jgi:hypothetical protein
VSSCTLRIIIILMETIKDLYQIATSDGSRGYAPDPINESKSAFLLRSLRHDAPHPLRRGKSRPAGSSPRAGRGADEDACDRCHAAPIILIATKIGAATAIMAMAADVPAPKPRPTMGMLRFHFLSFRRTQNNRRCLSFPPYNGLVFSAMYSSSVVRTDGGSFGADNMRSMIDTESPEAL